MTERAWCERELVDYKTGEVVKVGYEFVKLNGGVEEVYRLVSEKVFIHKGVPSVCVSLTSYGETEQGYVSIAWLGLIHA